MDSRRKREKNCTLGMRNFHRRAVSNYVEPLTRPESFDSF